MSGEQATDELPHLPQRQDSLCDQLWDLRYAAVRLGMYDAHAWLVGMTRWLPAPSKGGSDD